MVGELEKFDLLHQFYLNQIHSLECAEDIVLLVPPCRYPIVNGFGANKSTGTGQSATATFTKKSEKVIC